MGLIWTNGGIHQKHVRDNRLKRKMARSNFRMHYDLAFDGGGSAFDEYYRTLVGARVSAFFWIHFCSWGGSAKLYPHPEPLPAYNPRHRRRRMTGREAYTLYRKQKLTRAEWSAIIHMEVRTIA